MSKPVNMPGLSPCCQWPDKIITRTGVRVLRKPVALAGDATPTQAMTLRLSALAGKAAYALRKQTVEPVFGIIKSVTGFRQFSLRGLRKVTGEWNLVCLAWNVKRMAVLRPKAG
jgi:hypothetical protein